MNAPIDFKARGQSLKAERLVEVIETDRRNQHGFDGYADAGRLAEWLGKATEQMWLEWQREAGFTKKMAPSFATRAIVIATFVGRIDRARGR